MRFSILGSGSSGNLTWVETRDTRILLDAGLSLKESEKRLAAIGRRPADVQAVLLTHEHDDHARGLELLSREVRLAVIATQGTLKAVKRWLAPGTERIEISADGSVRFADLLIEAFRVPHDAAEPVGFRLHHGAASLGYATDLGTVSASVREGLSGLQTVIVESNHDLEMLKQGPYPPRLKKRILGPYGHLSNDAVGELLATADLRALKLLVLAHLSRTNNRPELAAATAAVALAARGLDPALHLARHDRPTETYDLADGRSRGPFPAVTSLVARVLERPRQMLFSFD